MNDDKRGAEHLGQLEVTNAIGMKLLLSVASVDDAYKRMRYMGARGWTTGKVPPGGFTMPYCMADTFDYSLIGAREFIGRDNVRCIEHAGMIYKRRDEAAVEKASKKMPAKIWYSRGAKASDGETKTDDGTIKFVTLIQFVGGGRSIAEFEKPRSAAREERPQAQTTQTQTTQEKAPDHTAPTLEAVADKLLVNLDATQTKSVVNLATAKGLNGPQLRVIVGSITGDINVPIHPNQLAKLFDKIKKSNAAVAA